MKMISKYIKENDILESFTDMYNEPQNINSILTHILAHDEIEKTKKLKWIDCFFSMMKKVNIKPDSIQMVKAIDICKEKKFVELEKRIQDYLSN